MVGIVTATGKFKQIDPSADRRQPVAAGVLLQACDATLADRDDGLVVARHAIVATTRSRGPTHHHRRKLTAIAQLKALGVLVRQRSLTMNNPFSNPAFSMAALTAAINILPNRYGRLEELNLMPSKTGASAPDRRRGNERRAQPAAVRCRPVRPARSACAGKRKLRSFVVPHPHDDVVLPRKSRASAPSVRKPRNQRRSPT